MTLKTKLTLIKTIGIILLIPFVCLLLFYFGLIIPEYCACDPQMYEGGTGTTIWGDLVDCGAESRDFIEAFFQMFSVINLGFTMALIGLLYNYRNLRSKQGMETHIISK